MAYRLNSSNVVQDTIDGEVLAIRSDTGTYYSMQGPTATAWCALISGADLAEVSRLVAAHHDADRDAVAEAVVALAAELAEESLLTDAAPTSDSESSTGSPPIELPPETKGEAWGALTFEKYTDMQDLLLFDPIHEVEPSGWPAVARDDT